MQKVSLSPDSRRKWNIEFYRSRIPAVTQTHAERISWTHIRGFIKWRENVSKNDTHCIVSHTQLWPSSLSFNKMGQQRMDNARCWKAVRLNLSNLLHWKKSCGSPYYCKHLITPCESAWSLSRLHLMCWQLHKHFLFQLHYKAWMRLKMSLITWVDELRQFFVTFKMTSA